LILAQGEFSSARILGAAVAMSCGRTADHEGPTQRHPNGWGAVWRDRGGFAIHRDPRPLEDTADRSPIAGLATRFLAVHARHATLTRNHGSECTHPIEVRHADQPWYLLHNGFLPTVYQRLGKSQSEFDSAEYLEYLVRDTGPALDLETTAARLRAIPPGGTSANAFLMTADDAYVIHWTPEDTRYPRYFTMHRLETERCTIIASEVVPELAPPERWRPMPARTIQRLSLAA
jgi:glutamine amidotransferase